MTKRTLPVKASHLEVLKRTGRPLFDLGQVVATPAALRHLAANALLPAAILSPHQHGGWGDVDDHDARANDEAVLSGARILSVHSVGGEKLWIITEAANEHGERASTCILFPREY
jgi:hypothetical protein